MINFTKTQPDVDSSIPTPKAQSRCNYRFQRGANFVEYVILLMLIAFVVLVIPRLMGDRLSTQFSNFADDSNFR